MTMIVFSTPTVFTEGKNPPRNEDAIGYNEMVLVLSDGATDKSGQSFDGRTGGELASELIVESCLKSDLNGVELVEYVSAQLRSLYEKINPNALTDSAFRFAATMVIARIADDSLIVTQVGDSGFRINGTEEYLNDKLVDQLTASARSEYIAATGDIAGGRDFIMPLLKTQHLYQNNSDTPLGHGVIDGTPVPEQFVKVYTFAIDTVRAIELVSDGYFGAFPSEVNIQAYESLRHHIESVDPHKCTDFPSTKESDDRTVIIAEFSRA